MALLSCSGNKTGQGEEALHSHFVVDIKGKSDAALLKETMANISARLVRLESNDSNFIDTESSRLYLTNDWIFVLEGEQIKMQFLFLTVEKFRYMILMGST